MSKPDKNPSDQVTEPSKAWLVQTADAIEYCLEGFNLKTRVRKVEFRKSSTLFKCECPGYVSLSEIETHALDLARMVRSITGKVDLVLPIPGTHYFGVVVPYTKDAERTVVEPRIETVSPSTESGGHAEADTSEKGEVRSVRRRLADILHGLANRVDDTPVNW